ncbi:GlxA family transcriptional regulator [Devosia sp. XJ19-1]|uniref:GlxA family transcriptional regulator n=1 Tax=Devosia ureilytica TaxID=2952754 RepID=A0A9Q4AMU6_9HYPH|nr:GlxA family transcriptional regulator [Devosia ureilytica]MCP8883130.1 GlxA family transcriptional regulator [Devosia ureilytica]MCP8886502.1 GlxA family transcriptional regulator [Devosia ureilytica]
MAQPIRYTEIGLLIYPGCAMASVHGLTDAFEVANQYADQHGGPVRIRTTHWRHGESGLARVFDSQPGDGAPDYVVIPGRLADPLTADDVADFVPWLIAQHAHGTTLASVCGGAFMLGHSGLLDGRRATTHWLYADAFQAMFPDVSVTPSDIVVEDGDIITAGGMLAWTDLGLRLIHRVLGPTVMAEAAKFLLVDPAGREQRHYSTFAPRLTHGDTSVLKVQHWLQAHSGEEINVSALAGRAGLEQRTFLRRFQKATGLKPTEYVQALRIGHAREKLEFSRDSVERIAFNVGYKDPSAFRRVFQKVTGLSASAYRERFSTASA